MALCDHCGRDTGITYGGLTKDDGTVVRLCHSGDPNRPDCYRRVTVYKEEIGVLNRLPSQNGVEHIYDPGLTYLTQFGEEFPAETTVCITHLRFVPCRKTDGFCVFSDHPAMVDQVRRYQMGEGNKY